MAEGAGQDTPDAGPHEYRGGDRLILGIVLAVTTFGLFAQTALNIAPVIRESLAIPESLLNTAVSISALSSGIFIVVAGGLADRVGRVKLTNIGLALSVIGSFLIASSPAGTAAFLIAGRAIQGLSAACIIPATLALMKAYFDGKERQRALSYWSIASWGGSGAAALFGGFLASSIGWRSIFWLSILVALVSVALIRGTPESTVPANPGRFVDLALFKNKTYTGATLSNFLINGAAGTLLVALSLVQQEAGLSSMESGLLTVGYLAAILSTIRMGEKLLQHMGPRRPMLIGCGVTATGILLTTFTFLLARQYMVVEFVGFTLFGVGLGVYATPSTDAALSSAPQDKAGAASGLYKMSSSLGAAFGIAVSAALFTGLASLGDGFGFADLFLGRTDNVDVRFAAAMALLFNVLMAIGALLAVAVTVPRSDPRPVRNKERKLRA